LLALAFALAGCEDAADRAAQPSEPAATPTPSPSVASVAAALGGGDGATPAEQAFADAVTAVAHSLGSDDADVPSASPDDVLTPLRKAGLAGADFDGEADYFAWIAPRRSLRFLGHEVALVITEEMRAGFIGCCVSDGVTLILAPAGSRAGLEQFATAQRCRIEPASRNIRFDMATTDNPALRSRTGLMALSCHDRDINQ
jgi:hypothetical protein